MPRGRQPARAGRGVRVGRAGARHLLRPDGDVRAARRRGRGLRAPRVRPRLRRCHATPARCSTASGAGRARAGVDEPRRPRHRACRRASARSASSEGAPFAVIADDHRRYLRPEFHPEVVHTPHGAQLLRNFTHAVAGLLRRLDDGRLPRRRDRAHPRAGRVGARDLRPVRRRRFLGRRGADPRGDRRSAHLHLRRSRPAARRRGGGGGAAPSATASTSAWCTATPPTCSSARWPASPIPKPSARPSAGCSSRCSRRRRRSSAAPTSSRRARCIPT